MSTLWCVFGAILFLLAVGLPGICGRNNRAHILEVRCVNCLCFTGMGVLLLMSLCSYSIASDTRHAYNMQGKSSVITTEKYPDLIQSPDEVIQGLESALADNPNSSKGWYLLGSVYLNLQQYQSAQACMQKAKALAPSESAYMIGYAAAYFFNHQQTLLPDLKQRLQHIAHEHPSNTSALNLLAVDAYCHHDFTQAISYWDVVLQQPTIDKDDRQALEQMRAKALAQSRQ